MIKKISFFILKHFYSRVISPKNKIVFISEGHSGCNSRAQFTYTKTKEISYEIELIDSKKYDKSSFTGFCSFIKKLCEAKVLASTHGPIILKGRKTFDFWHSVHLKATGAMEIKKNRGRIKTDWDYVDGLASYSSFYTTSMSACFLSDPHKFKITGVPRNDLLYNTDSREKLLKVLKSKRTDAKVLFFAPTFRLGYGEDQGNKDFSNIFGLEKFDSSLFNKFLKENNHIFVYKLHPNEEPFLGQYINNIDPEFSFNLSNTVLEKENLDLYEVLGGVDLLITDYSGIYFDFLLLNRPCVFCPIDLEAYTKNRGFLMDPYDDWTPGPKVYGQSDLQEEIDKSISDKRYFEEDRLRLNRIINHFHDGRSRSRIQSELEKLLL
ncbi:MAG: hypothetical protein BM556_08975 [Bacteriovorax sp. MedPE-SWde]|nr:MAG: hypothetical protein BM556_08975 [Bacteriovorax sp. MedPE-SWde]